MLNIVGITFTPPAPCLPGQLFKFSSDKMIPVSDQLPSARRLTCEQIMMISVPGTGPRAAAGPAPARMATEDSNLAFDITYPLHHNGNWRL
jgi:hypothetical protein